MIFLHDKHYGRDCFYPFSKDAQAFVEAFPHSSGKRKSLTLKQINLLKEIGADLNVQKKIIIDQINIGSFISKLQGENCNESATNSKLLSL